MNLPPRQQQILHLIRDHGTVTVEAMSERFAVSTQTIRRDLADLGTAGLARRIHGGASAIDAVSVFNVGYRERGRLNRPAKDAIARRAARLIPDHCSLSLNIGTTTEGVARALAGHRDLVVVSNNINIINGLISTGQHELIMAGGTVRASDGAVIGEQTVDFIARYKVDFALIGCSAIDDDGAVLDFDAREVSVARAMLDNARTRVLVCDAAKFLRTAPVRICDLAALDYLITDREPSPAFMERAAAADTQVLVATPQDHDPQKAPEATHD